VKRVLITGADGFIGKNLVATLGRREGVEVVGLGKGEDHSSMVSSICRADFIFHLAGVNRPHSEDEFLRGNTELTRFITNVLLENGKKTPLLLSSSTQAALDNPYGISKRLAEECVFEYGGKAGAPVHVYRLANVFGKWCRPNYNSVVATFCYNIARNLDIRISDASTRVQLVYIDDVVTEFAGVLHAAEQGFTESIRTVLPTYTLSLGELADRIYRLRDIRRSLVMPDLSESFMRCLYATYLSYLDTGDFCYSLDWKTDNRGSLAEFLKSEHFGQMFISKSHAGIIRGNHYHDTKVEKFCVLQGNALIRFRHILGNEVLSYTVSGEKPVVVDIPPGYTHSIENLSGNEMIVLFWANQVFDPEKPDTFCLPVDK
jgi:UDP-2-acetamido-2,6-beta-L-arabino-hexul-4-ose reductase